ncbi:pathogenicity island protein [Paenibacillus sp. FSL R10-2782]|uniref:pathogenicity island protein n=1 Tax=Paenibacillus sp. FSL R10-2782 TaxID=2954661 RepID=UPI0031586E1B
MEALYEIATLPSDERTREYTLKSGVTKVPDEMTVRELREVKAALKAEREAREQAEARAEKAEALYKQRKSPQSSTLRTRAFNVKLGVYGATLT